MSRSRAAGLLAGLALCALSGCSDDAPPASAPNVLLITLDTTRFDYLGCSGDERGLTPQLDALAADSANFTRAMSTAGLTPMSHASILTGLNNYAHGLRVFYGELGHSLPKDVPTLPAILAQNGWHTAAFVSAHPLSEVYGLDRGYQRFSVGVEDTLTELDLSQKGSYSEILQDARRNESQRRADHTTDEALAWLEEQRDAGSWHLWLHYFDVHDVSLIPPAEFAARYGVRYDSEPPFEGARTSEAWYELELRWVDSQVARIVRWLEQNGEYENTLIVVVADHGQGLQDGLERHGWREHRLLYDWSLHVPLILRLPGRPAGERVTSLVSTIDILPTLLEALDIAPPGGLEGHSLLPLLRGDPPVEHLALADALNLEDSYSPILKLPEDQRDNLYVAMDGRWKLIQHAATPGNSQLFDLEADPLELHNVIEEHPEEAARLLQALVERRAFRREPAATDSAAPDARALNSLGYTGDDEPRRPRDADGSR